MPVGVAQWLAHWIIDPKVPGLILGPAGNGHCGDLIEDSIQDHSPSTADSSGKAVSCLHKDRGIHWLWHPDGSCKTDMPLHDH